MTQWIRLEHSGPSMYTFSKHADTNILDVYIQKEKINLDIVQTYLVYLYYDKYYLKVDHVFQENFWKSLLNDSKVSRDNQVVIKKKRKPSRFFDVERGNLRVVLPDGEEIHETLGTCDCVPSIFVGRDPSHPKRGTCKRGVQPSDITLNMTHTFLNQAKLRGFRKFVQNKNVRWVACWTDPLTHDTKYLNFSNHLRLEKFDKARLLKKRLNVLREKQKQDIQKTSETRRQLALAVYLLEHLCIRIGNEKDVSNEADTVGCCTLKAYSNIFIKNVTQKRICLTFLGKDSVPFQKDLVLPDPFYVQCERMLSKRSKDELFFSRISPNAVNRYIHNVAPGCSAKTFRTLKASTTFQSCLKRTNDVTLANRKVANLLNHRKGPLKDKLNLETSRKNYIDPRVYVAYCKKNDVTPKHNWVTPELFQKTSCNFLF